MRVYFHLSNRAQSHYCGFGQCRKDNHPVSVVSVFLETWMRPRSYSTFKNVDYVCFCFVLFCSHANSLTKEAVHTSPTIGSNVEQITVRKTHFLVWDIGGQESLRASWYSYYCNTEVEINNNNTNSINTWLFNIGSLLRNQSKYITWLYFPSCHRRRWRANDRFSTLWLFQIVILVVDSTDRERLTLSKEEFHRMLSHEVQTLDLTAYYYFGTPADGFRFLKDFFICLFVYCLVTWTVNIWVCADAAY